MLKSGYRPLERGRRVEVDKILILQVDKPVCIANRGQQQRLDIAFPADPGDPAVRRERPCDDHRGRSTEWRIDPRRVGDGPGNWLARPTQTAFRPGVDFRAVGMMTPALDERLKEVPRTRPHDPAMCIMMRL